MSPRGFLVASSPPVGPSAATFSDAAVAAKSVATRSVTPVGRVAADTVAAGTLVPDAVIFEADLMVAVAVSLPGHALPIAPVFPSAGFLFLTLSCT